MVDFLSAPLEKVRRLQILLASLKKKNPHPPLQKLGLGGGGMGNTKKWSVSMEATHSYQKFWRVPLGLFLDEREFIACVHPHSLLTKMGEKGSFSRFLRGERADVHRLEN